MGVVWFHVRGVPGDAYRGVVRQPDQPADGDADERSLRAGLGVRLRRRVA
jgi:hypothetical protein